jgi:heme exporter protein D
MSDFWQMGGYGVYVWSSFGLTGLVLLYQFLLPLWRHREYRQALLKNLAEEEAIK